VGAVDRALLGAAGLQRIDWDVRAADVNPQNHASLAVAARAGFERVEAPTVRRPECDRLADDFFARLRD
jgi:RimJ/RimL family protein N-acetyltransferase